jgi:hypothetical protein
MDISHGEGHVVSVGRSCRLRELPYHTRPVRELAKVEPSRLRHVQFLLDFIAADNSMGFHAPQESARVLSTAIDLARLGQLELRPSPRAAGEQPPPAP